VRLPPPHALLLSFKGEWSFLSLVVWRWPSYAYAPIMAGQFGAN